MTTATDDVAVQFSTREVPWMKLGRLVDKAVTAAEAAKIAKLDFTVSLKNASWTDEDGTVHPIPSRRAIIHDDTKMFMGFASATVYQPLQYSEAFSFMDTVNPSYVAAGSLRSGRQGFMVVEAPDTAKLNILDGDDPHDLFAVLRTSHDCSRGIEVMAMPLRSRCMNQLTLSSFSKGVTNRWSIKHTTKMHIKLAEAQESLAKLGLYAKRMNELVDRLANTNVSAEKADHILKIVIPMPKYGKTERTETQYAERLNAITSLWLTAPTVGYAGTGWGLVNAVSEYYDWHRVGGTAESRFIAAIEGQTYKAVNKTAGLVLSNA